MLPVARLGNRAPSTSRNGGYSPFEVIDTEFGETLGEKRLLVRQT